MLPPTTPSPNQPSNATAPMGAASPYIPKIYLQKRTGSREEASAAASAATTTYSRVKIGETDQMHTDAQHEISGYSITPRTLRERTLVVQSCEDLREKVHKSISELDESIVGLNATPTAQIDNSGLSEEQVHALRSKWVAEAQQTQKASIYTLEQQKKDLESVVTAAKALDNNLQSTPSLYIEKYDNRATEITRYGVNLTQELARSIKEYNTSLEGAGAAPPRGAKASGGSSKTAPTPQLSIPLHPLEILLLQDAIKYFLSGAANKAVVFDIFARDTGNMKILTETLDAGAGAAPPPPPSKPKTHAVVLFKKSDKEFVIIDPSNSTFSKHLVESSKLFIPKDIALLVPKGEFKIYSPAAKVTTGPAANQFRDCIDIAVKIAFGLQKMQGVVDPQKLAELPCIKEVTNDTQVNESIFFSPDEAVARIRQASSDQIRERAETLLVAMAKQMKGMSVILNSTALTDATTQIYKTAFSKEYTYSEYDKGLQELFGVFTSARTEYCQTMEAQAQALKTSILGEAANNTGEE